MPPCLASKRLLLRALELSDAEQVQLVFPQWEIVRYLNVVIPWPYPPDGALVYFRDVVLPAVEREEQWHWTLRLKEAPDEIIGAIGLVRGERSNRGFWLAPPWHGRGLMTEAVVAANDYWFDVLGFDVLRSLRAVANHTSRRIAEKTGMRLIATGEGHFVCGRLPQEMWEITAQEWHAIRGNFAEPQGAAGPSLKLS